VAGTATFPTSSSSTTVAGSEHDHLKGVLIVEDFLEVPTRCKKKHPRRRW
jgi:hypothetical protein